MPESHYDDYNPQLFCFFAIFIVHFKRKRIKIGLTTSASSLPGTFWQIEKSNSLISGKFCVTDRKLPFSMPFWHLEQ